MLLFIHEACKAYYHWDHFESQLAKKALATIPGILQQRAQATLQSQATYINKRRKYRDQASPHASPSDLAALPPALRRADGNTSAVRQKPTLQPRKRRAEPDALSSEKGDDALLSRQSSLGNSTVFPHLAQVSRPSPWVRGASSPPRRLRPPPASPAREPRGTAERNHRSAPLRDAGLGEERERSAERRCPPQVQPRALPGVQTEPLAPLPSRPRLQRPTDPPRRPQLRGSGTGAQLRSAPLAGPEGRPAPGTAPTRNWAAAGGVSGGGSSCAVPTASPPRPACGERGRTPTCANPALPSLLPSPGAASWGGSGLRSAPPLTQSAAAPAAPTVPCGLLRPRQSPLTAEARPRSLSPLSHGRREAFLPPAISSSQSTAPKAREGWRREAASATSPTACPRGGPSVCSSIEINESEAEDHCKQKYVAAAVGTAQVRKKRSRPGLRNAKVTPGLLAHFLNAPGQNSFNRPPSVGIKSPGRRTVWLQRLTGSCSSSTVTVTVNIALTFPLYSARPLFASLGKSLSKGIHSRRIPGSKRQQPPLLAARGGGRQRPNPPFPPAPYPPR
ncbi:mucin-1-like [Colius striatus]|uniref:mucin-1-like n=1 Tax=Colius striatus TaxID=57412 RepID=UPI002B1E12B2|nr:mucin-1-like [Colius striatus]